MTFYHFMNCLLLTFAPYYLVYRFTKLYDYSTFAKCAYAGGFYILTAAFKLMVLGSIFPAAFPAEPEHASLLQAIVRFVFDLSDVAALYYVVSQFQRDLKILVPAVGWAATESIVSRFLLLLVGARASEFEWKYVQASVEANIELLHYVCVTTLLFLLSRKDLPKSLTPLLVGLLLLGRLDDVVVKLLEFAFPMGSWTAILVKIVLALIVATLTHTVYQSSASQLKRT